MKTEPEPAFDVPTFRQQALFEAYKEAIKSALESANSTADTVATAAFSVATAYGALLGLVKPEKQTVGVALLLPILLFAGAALLACVARSLGVRIALTPNTVEGVESDVKGIIEWKRRLVWVAIVLAAAALVSAGALVVAVYEPGATR